MKKKTVSKRDDALKEALGQFYDFARGEDVDVTRSRRELEVTNIALLRLQLGLSQRAFAEKVGVSVDTLQNWEQGRRKPSGPARTLLKIIAEDPTVIGDSARTAKRSGNPDNASKQAKEGWTGSHPIAVHIGQRIRQRRWMIGMTQKQVAEKLGTKFQRIQSIEIGRTWINSAQLWDIAAVLEVPVSFFFAGLEGQEAEPREARGDILTDKQALELVRAYYSMPERQRRRLFELVHSLSSVKDTPLAM